MEEIKVYISGPMTGIKDLNRSAFDSVAEELRAAGFCPVNPHDVCADMPMESSWSDYMRQDIKALMDCDAVYAIGFWIKSRGATAEIALAHQLDIPVFVTTDKLKEYFECKK